MIHSPKGSGYSSKPQFEIGRALFQHSFDRMSSQLCSTKIYTRRTSGLGPAWRRRLRGDTNTGRGISPREYRAGRAAGERNTAQGIGPLVSLQPVPLMSCLSYLIVEPAVIQYGYLARHDWSRNPSSEFARLQRPSYRTPKRHGKTPLERSTHST